MRLSTTPTEPATDAVPGSRQLILAVSAARFASQGYKETSMKQIADEVGMKTASIYYHFASKEEVLTEILSISITSVSSDVQRAVNAMGAGASASEKLFVAIDHHVRALYRQPDYTFAAIRCAGKISKKALRKGLPMREAYEKFWQALFDDLASTGQMADGVNASLLRPFVLHSLNRTLAWYDPKRSDIDELVRIALQFAAAFVKSKWQGASLGPA